MRAIASSGGRRPGGDLLEQRIVEAGDHRAGIGGAAVEADAEAGGAAIGGDAAVVGDEVLLRVLGGDPALEGVAVEPDVALARHAGGRGVADRGAVGDADLRLDDVDAGHLLGDGVLDLDARIDLDEIELAGVGIHQELDRAGAGIVRGMGDGDGVAGELLPLGVVEIGRGRALDDLLVAALDGAVALEEVDDGAVLVGEDLHLDVAGALDQLLEIDLVAAEGGLGLAPGGVDVVEEARLVADDPHAAAAAAPRRLEHQRIADLAGDAWPPRRARAAAARSPASPARRPRRRDCAPATLSPSRRMVSGDGPMKVMPGGGAGLGEVRVLGQEAVAGMDRVGLRLAGDADDLGDRQIGLDRPEALADLVGLVGLEAVEGELVLLGEDRDGPDAELVGRPEDADGDLRPVGDENLPDCHASSPAFPVAGKAEF